MFGDENGCWRYGGHGWYEMNEGEMGCCLAFFPMNLVSFITLKTCKNHRLLLVGRFEVPTIAFLYFCIFCFRDK